MHWIGISFDSSDLLNIINAPPSLCAALATHFGAKVNSHKLAFSRHNTGLLRNQVSRVSVEAVRNRCREVKTAHIGAVDQGDSDGSGSDTWYCCRDEGFVEGGTVY
jgi:hypothetical protein